jgi:2-polyprenyl-3-methyl-5-hydroxy-6-metoxy-1,4-benzoquinol methylase
MAVKKFIERDSRIINMCRNKSVLHLGCVGFTDCAIEEKVRQACQSLHAAITDCAASCTGVDLDSESINQLREQGVFLNVIEGNVEHLEDMVPELRGFDVVVAGDIIEHLSNPGLMLDGIRSRLATNGRVIISTPNAFGVASWLRVLTGRFKEGAQHVLCFNPYTLTQLVERHGYEVELAASCYQSRARTNYGPLFGFLRTVLEKFPILGGTLLYVCRVKA